MPSTETCEAHSTGHITPIKRVLDHVFLKFGSK
jgi:hypothetical protein